VKSSQLHGDHRQRADISERRNTEQELQNTRLQDLAQTIDPRNGRPNSAVEHRNGANVWLHRAEAETNNGRINYWKPSFPMSLSDI